MSYRSRLYNHRNAQSTEANDTPFFSKQHDRNDTMQKGMFFQAKLSINKPGDQYEQEADSVANTVVNNKPATPVLQQKKISSIQRLSTPAEDEKLGTNDARMEKDREIQEKPIQRMTIDPEKEKMKGIQKMDDPEKEKMEGIQKMDDPMKEEEDKKKTTAVQTKQDVGANTASAKVSSKIENSSGKGNALPKNTLHEMSSSFGVDFSAVHIHNDSESAGMNKELQAQAFTHGSDIYFNEGKYNPENTEGKFLLAHELTHVVQQSANNNKAVPEKKNSSIQKQATASPAATTPSATVPPPGAGTTTCGKPAGCPSLFCTPFPFQFMATKARNESAPVLLAGIAAAVSPRVVPIWSQYLFGGSAPQNLSSKFGSDFTSSDTTKKAAIFLMGEIKSSLIASPPVFPPGSSTVVLSLSSLIKTQIDDLNTPGSGHDMNFNVIGEIPGNIAGGIGKTQVSCSVGATPSPFDDSRSASGTVTVIKNPGGSLTVIPNILFSVQDTIDLCPGNCGALKEQAATVPMSMMEASGVSGDVPFNVDFSAPATETMPFTITPVAPPPAPKPTAPAKVKVRASPFLRIRESPNTSSPILGKYLNGAEIVILCMQDGEDVLGNKKWGKTDSGFVSDFYLNHLDSNTPPGC